MLLVFQTGSPQIEQKKSGAKKPGDLKVVPKKTPDITPKKWITQEMRKIIGPSEDPRAHIAIITFDDFGIVDGGKLQAILETYAKTGGSPRDAAIVSKAMLSQASWIEANMSGETRDRELNQVRMFLERKSYNNPKMMAACWHTLRYIASISEGRNKTGIISSRSRIRVLGINPECDFKFSATPSSQQNRFELMRDYLRTEAGARQYMEHIQTAITGLYSRLGIPELALSDGMREIIMYRLMSIKRIKGVGSELGDADAIADHDFVNVDTTGTNLVKKTRHELYHIGSEAKLTPVITEGITALLSNSGYPHTVTAIENYLKNLNKTEPAYCKRVLDATILTWLDMATPEQQKLAVQTIDRAAEEAFRKDRGPS